MLGHLSFGAPGLRRHHDTAFVIDPDGYKLEAIHQ
jgi:hypothetical protein